MVEKRTAWGPPGAVKGICLVGIGTEDEHAARSDKAFYCEDHNKVKTKATSTPAADPSESESPPASDGGGGAYSDAERRPGTPPPKSPKRGLTALLGKKSPGGDAAATTPKGTQGERRPSANKARRVGTLDFWGDVVEGGASVVGRAGYVPMARSMAWSSPVAGEIIENATKDTFVDKLIQPVVRNQAKWQDLFDLLGLWGAIGIAQANPAQAEQVTSALQRLTAPEQMGKLFQAMALLPPSAPPPPGF